MKPYYQIDITYDDGEKSAIRYETVKEAMETMRRMLAYYKVDSAILGRYSDAYPTGYDYICSIKNKSSLRGR